MLAECELLAPRKYNKIEDIPAKVGHQIESQNAPITIEDISPLLNNTLNQSDCSVNEYVKRNNMFIAKNKLSRINNAIDAIRDKWPKGTPLEIWIGFDLANCCSDDLLLRLDEPDFKQQVKTELNRRLSHQPISQPSTEGEADNDDDDDEEEDKTDREFAVSVVPQTKKTTTRRRKHSKKILYLMDQFLQHQMVFLMKNGDLGVTYTGKATWQE